MFQRALICTDFNDGMYRLAQFVPSLVEGGFKSLIFFHNVAVEVEREIPRNDPALLAAPKQRLTELLREVPADIEVIVEVQMGRPAENIRRLADKYKVDIIFLGTPTRTLLEEKLFGSTTAALIEKTTVPILILRPQLIATYTTAELELRCAHLFRYLLLPYNGREGAQQSIASIQRQLTANPDSILERIRLLWVIDENVRPELHGDNPLHQAQKELEQVQADLAKFNLVVNTSVIEGDPIKEIIQAAETYDIGAIATCTGNISNLMKWSAPSLTRELVRHIWHPVLVFPS